MKVKRLGTFGIDTGQFIICDPAYLDKWKDNEFSPDDSVVGEFSYNGACCTSLTGGGSLVNKIGARLAVVGSTGGDGEYAVDAHIDKEGRIRKIEVTFGEGE
jgi:hypothetical protein